MNNIKKEDFGNFSSVVKKNKDKDGRLVFNWKIFYIYIIIGFSLILLNFIALYGINKTIGGVVILVDIPIKLMWFYMFFIETYCLTGVGIYTIIIGIINSYDYYQYIQKKSKVLDMQNL